MVAVPPKPLKKIALDVPSAPTSRKGNQPPSVSKSPSSAAPSYKTSPSLEPIKELQRSIINLSSKIESLANNFLSQYIFEHYVSRDQISSMKNVGSPGSDVDGIWKGRTQEALKIAAHFASGMLETASDLGLSLTNYDVTKLSELNKIAQTQYTDIDKKAELSPSLSQNLKDMETAFEAFSKFVTDNTEYQKYLSKPKSFAKYKTQKSGTEALSDEEKSAFEQHKNTIIPEITFSNVKDPKQNFAYLSDLYDIASFNKLMQRIGRNSNDPSQVKKTLDELSRALGSNVNLPDPGY